VVHVITSLGAGGAEKQVEFLVRDCPYDVEVVALYEGGIVGDLIAAGGTPVTVLGMVGWRKPLAIARLARLLRDRRPDVVHVHLLAAQLWGIPAARLARCPVIVSTEHSLMADMTEGRPLTPQLRGLYRVLAALADRTVAVSEATAKRLHRLGVPADRITVIENGIDLDALRFTAEGRAAVRLELGLSPNTTVVGAVGRLAPVKRLDVLITALRELLGAGAVELVIAGAGPLEKDLRQQAVDQGSGAAVRLVGTRADLAPLLSAFDVFVSPSRDETFGMAVVEAAASGLPLVYGECPALDELAEPLPGTVRIPLDAGVDAERSIIRSAVAAARPTETGREQPAALGVRFGTEALRAAVDSLYSELTADRLTAGGRTTRR
jgi:glycosyltransferase involved in cell wall biosynthesis